MAHQNPVRDQESAHQGQPCGCAGFSKNRQVKRFGRYIPRSAAWLGSLAADLRARPEPAHMLVVADIPAILRGACTNSIAMLVGDLRRVTISSTTVQWNKVQAALCTRCFNLQVAKLDGLDSFEHADFEPIGLSGPTGKIHEFHFRARLFGTGVALDAFELHQGNPEGYRFRVIDEAHH